MIIPFFQGLRRYRFTMGFDMQSQRFDVSYQDLSDPASEPATFLEGQHSDVVTDLSADSEWVIYTTERTGEAQLDLAPFTEPRAGTAASTR